jgi:hypothetical protein
MEKIAEMTEGQIHKVAGKFYSRFEMHELPSPAAMAKPLEFNTLSGLADYVRSNLDQTGAAPHAVVVVDASNVKLVSGLKGDFRQRETLATAHQVAHAPYFQFSRYMTPEDFVIELQTKFVYCDNRRDVLNVIGNLRAEGAVATKDDGVSQTVEVRTGVARLSTADLPNPVELTPYRTFDEIEQPPSPFVLRIANEDGQSRVALFETGCRSWRQEAILRVKAHLETLIDLPIFG